jgi:hypothetical protein
VRVRGYLSRLVLSHQEDLLLHIFRVGTGSVCNGQRYGSATRKDKRGAKTKTKTKTDTKTKTKTNVKTKTETKIKKNTNKENDKGIPDRYKGQSSSSSILARTVFSFKDEVRCEL